MGLWYWRSQSTLASSSLATTAVVDTRGRPGATVSSSTPCAAPTAAARASTSASSVMSIMGTVSLKFRPATAPRWNFAQPTYSSKVAFGGKWWLWPSSAGRNAFVYLSPWRTWTTAQAPESTVSRQDGWSRSHAAARRLNSIRVLRFGRIAMAANAIMKWASPWPGFSVRGKRRTPRRFADGST